MQLLVFYLNVYIKIFIHSYTWILRDGQIIARSSAQVSRRIYILCNLSNHIDLSKFKSRSRGSAQVRRLASPPNVAEDIRLLYSFPQLRSNYYNLITTVSLFIIITYCLNYLLVYLFKYSFISIYLYLYTYFVILMNVSSVKFYLIWFSLIDLMSLYGALATPRDMILHLCLIFIKYVWWVVAPVHCVGLSPLVRPNLLLYVHVNPLCTRPLVHVTFSCCFSFLLLFDVSLSIVYPIYNNIISWFEKYYLFIYSFITASKIDTEYFSCMCYSSLWVSS